MDVWVDETEFTVAELQEPEVFFRYGRPGYYANLCAGNAPSIKSYTIELLEKKLLSDARDGDLTLEKALARREDCAYCQCMLACSTKFDKPHAFMCWSLGRPRVGIHLSIR